jgi:hypothetical protein
MLRVVNSAKGASLPSRCFTYFYEAFMVPSMSLSACIKSYLNYPSRSRSICEAGASAPRTANPFQQTRYRKVAASRPYYLVLQLLSYYQTPLNF